MANLNEDAQWIVMLGFLISIILVFLALIVNQSALIGQTTSESVLEFPKSEIQDTRAEVMEYFWNKSLSDEELHNLSIDLLNISLERKGAIIYVDNETDPVTQINIIYIHFNDGMTDFHEIIRG
jgi:hypothetical protein